MNTGNHLLSLFAGEKVISVYPGPFVSKLEWKVSEKSFEKCFTSLKIFMIIVTI
jgi:hypothetical protein